MHDDFTHILDEHLSRISDIHKCLFYKADCDADSLPVYSNAHLDAYLEKADDEDLPTSHELNRLHELKKALVEQSHAHLEKADKDKKPPSQEKYNDFELLSHEFILRLRRLEYDLTQEGNGFDILTGMRSKAVLYQDLEREMSACMRRMDYQIAIGFGRIDDFEKMTNALDADGLKESMRKLSAVLRESMRVYDDAYNLPNEYFVISLKHTDIVGAGSALDRFVKSMEYESIPADAEGHKKLTVSFVVARLEPGTDLRSFLNELRNDLDNHRNDRSLVLEYNDKSKLEKYIEQFQG
jgi:GGDEF domain-containing protein